MKRTIITLILLGFFVNAHASVNTFVLSGSSVPASAQYYANGLGDGFNFCHAIRFGEYAEFKALLSKGMNPNFRCSGQHPLYLATDNGDLKMVRDLLNFGANPKVKTYGKTALQLAKENGYDEIAKALSDAMGKKESSSNNAEKTDVLPSSLLNPYLRSPESSYDYGKNYNPFISQPEVTSSYDYGKVYSQLPKETNVAEAVFGHTWQSIVVVKDSKGQGSGVIVRPNIVATNCHVIDDEDVIVYKHDNRQASTDTAFRAKVLMRNDDQDFCLLEVSGLWGIQAQIRKYNTLKIGENVYALGSPQGLDLSLSTGIISQLRQGKHGRYIQTDAAISPGSSGGGLFDSDGNLIGILTGKIADEDSEGIGFAIPADLMEDLLR